MNKHDLRHASILIIEDNLPDVVLIKRFFADEKISNDMRYAANISQAREMLEQRHFDICFVDVNLPDGSGLDLVRELDSQQTTIIMLSDDEYIENLLTAQDLGAVAYISKPLSKATMDRLVKEIRHLHWSIVVEK